MIASPIAAAAAAHAEAARASDDVAVRHTVVLHEIRAYPEWRLQGVVDAVPGALDALRAHCDRAMEEAGDREIRAMSELLAALPRAASAADVAAAVEHAREMGGRDAAAEVKILRALAASLGERLFAAAA